MKRIVFKRNFIYLRSNIFLSRLSMKNQIVFCQVFCGFMVGIYSYAVDVIARADLVYKGMTITLPAELCIFIYIMEMGFNALLIYGAHMVKNLSCKGGNCHTYAWQALEEAAGCRPLPAGQSGSIIYG